MRSSPAAGLRSAWLLFFLAGCAAQPPAGEETLSPEPTAAAADTEDLVTEAASQSAEETAVDDAAAATDPALIDRTRQTVFSLVNSTSQWFDGFFGAASLENATNQSNDVRRGLLALGTRWDEVDGAQTRARFRAQFPLNAFKRRTRLLLGRGDTDDLIDGSETETMNNLPDQFSDFTDDDWLLGLGYSRRNGRANGFDFSVGTSIRSDGLDPYARISYRYSKTWGENVLWRLRPRVFWQDSRGEGTSLTSIFDVAATQKVLLRSWVTLTTEKKVEGLGWDADFLAYQSINNKNALSYRLFATGETDNLVELQDYGFEIRYRRRVLREWLFLEVSTGVSWPREFLEDVRESNLGVGLEIEMQFGEWPDRDSYARNRRR